MSDDLLGQVLAARDLVVRGAQLLDGTGAPARRGDLLVRRGRIAAVGEVGTTAGAAELDADGLVLCPGFIDMHAHSDLAVLHDPEHLSRTTQGVTTEVVGQDGLSYAPTDDAAMAVLADQLAGWNGVAPDGTGWADVTGYLAAVDERAAVNVCYLIPQGTLRLLVVGTEDRPATPSELARMQALVSEGMAQGAVGMSSGLTYVPGMFADTAELVELVSVVAGAGGFWAPHTRSYGRGALESYAEAIAIGRAAGCPAHLTHATMNFGLNAGRAGELLELVDGALAEGLDVSLDSYPYLPGSTTLAALLPSWAAVGGPAATLARLEDPDQLARIRHDLEVVGSDGCHGVPVDWLSLQVSGVREPALSHQVGQRLVDFEQCVDLLRRDHLGTTVLQHVGHEENVRTVMGHPRHMAGSDGLLTGARPHPRAWGSFARYLGHYVREQQVLTLPEAVARMTGRPAARLGLIDRGVLRVGAAADLVLFDPQTVAAGATFEQPRRPAIGIPHVWVAGVPVIRDGVRTGALPGRALRHRRPGS